MEVTHKSLLQYERLVNRVKGTVPVKVGYALSKNYLVSQPILKALRDTQSVPEDYQAYDKERIALCRSLAKKDDNGQPRMKTILTQNEAGESVPRTVFDFENLVAAEKQLEELSEKEPHKEAIAKYQERTEEFNKLLDEKVEVQFHELQLSDVPDDLFQLTDILLLTELGILQEVVLKK